MSIWRFQGTPAQVEALRGGFDRCDFPFEQLLPSLKAEGRNDIVVRFADLSRFGERAARAHDDGHSHITLGDAVAHPIERIVNGRRRVLGLFYLPPFTEVVLDSSLEHNPPLCDEVALAEAWHGVDYHLMIHRPALRRAVVNMLHDEQLPDDHPVDDGVVFVYRNGHVCSWFDGVNPHTGQPIPYRDWIGETMMALGTMAFAPTVQVSIHLAHHIEAADAAAFRRLMVGPAPAPVWSFRTSRAYHDEHRFPVFDRVLPKVTYDTPADAVAAGLRPCKVCRPQGYDRARQVTATSTEPNASQPTREARP